jgi:hypothetical protein
MPIDLEMETKEIKDSPFSYNEPNIDISKGGEAVDKIAIDPSIKTSGASEEALPEIAPSIPNIPSRSAFEQELKKENIPFPDIPVSFETGSIPAVVIDEIKSPIENNTNIAKNKKDPVVEIPEASKTSINSLALPEVPENNISSSFSKAQDEQQGSDPYKEMPM